MTPVVFLNHDFVDGMAHRTDLVPVAIGLHEAQQRLQPEPLRVHPDIGVQPTGAGSFIQWANRMRNASDDGHRMLSELLLRFLSGPFVTDLPTGDLDIERAEPPLPESPVWRCEAVRHLARHALSVPERRPWVLSFDPRSTLSKPRYRFEQGSAAVDVENLRSALAVGQYLGQLATQGLAGTLAILEEAARRSTRLIVLDKARDSARRWTLDCSTATLFKALVHLDAYAEALDEGLSRELAADRYYARCSIEMSRESAQVGKSPTCRRHRLIQVPDLGEQFFDMHAKPGSSTRIHVWTTKVDGRTRVFVGHCGEHLPLPKK